MANNSFATFFGASYPAVTDVVDTAPTYGDAINVLEGTFDPGGAAPNYPTEAEVLLGVIFGTTGSEEFTGNYRGPIVGDVRAAIAYGSLDSLTGVLDLPAINDVQAGIQFDNTTKTGVFGWPIEGDVRDGTSYGANDTEFTGTLVVASCDYPAASDVRLGVDFDSAGQMGTLDLPSINDVRLGVDFDNTTKTGNVTIPAIADVRSGTTFDSLLSSTGTLDLPSIEDVQDLVAFDNASKVGVFGWPIEGDVRAGIGYGANDTEFTGTLDVTGDPPVFPSQSDVRLGVTFGTTSSPTQFIGNVRVPPANRVEAGYFYDTNDTVEGSLQSGTIPAIEDVRFGVTFGDNDALTGVLELASESQTLIGVGFGAFGTEFTGTLTDLPGGSGLILPPVLGNGQLRSPLFIGDSFLAANGNAFQWTISPQLGFTTAATARFYGRDECDTDCTGPVSWDLTTNPVIDGVDWQLSFDMDTAISELIAQGIHEWYLVLEEGGAEITIESGEVTWVCK